MFLYVVYRSPFHLPVSYRLLQWEHTYPLIPQSPQLYHFVFLRRLTHNWNPSNVPLFIWWYINIIVVPWYNFIIVAIYIALFIITEYNLNWVTAGTAIIVVKKVYGIPTLGWWVLLEEKQKRIQTIVTKPGTKSLVWDYFGLRKDPEGKPIDNRLVTK